MPPTKVYYYVNENGTVPVLEWLTELGRRQPRAVAKCRAVLGQLRALGYELRRPTADYLDDGIYELRTRLGTTNYRILYGFPRRGVALVVHALTKEDRIPPAEFARAKRRLEHFLEDPDRHAHEEENRP